MAPWPAEIPRPLRFLFFLDPGAGARLVNVNSVFSTSLRVSMVAVSARRFQSKIFMDMVPCAARVWRPLELVKLEVQAAVIERTAVVRKIIVRG